MFTVGCLLALPAALAQHSEALECGYRKMMMAKVEQNLASGTPGSKLDVFEALELGTMCGETPPELDLQPALGSVEVPDRARSVFVGANAYPTVHAALAALRTSDGSKDTIVLKDGVHFLNNTMTLGAADSGITIKAAPGAEAWLSGGQPLGDSLLWSRIDDHPSGSAGVWAASLKGTGITKVPGLFGLKSHDRYVRSRFPNANPEHACWGYSCPDKDTWSLNSDQVELWHRPAAGDSPTPRTFDFSALPNPAGVLKNDSTQGPYNTWTDGSGGICADVWKGNSYWCSNASSGGWAEVDFQVAEAGQLQLPVAMSINFTKYAGDINPGSHQISGNRHDLSRIKSWANPEGAVVAAWHSQTWFLNFFTVDAARVRVQIIPTCAHSFCR